MPMIASFRLVTLRPRARARARNEHEAERNEEVGGGEEGEREGGGRWRV